MLSCAKVTDATFAGVHFLGKFACAKTTLLTQPGQFYFMTGFTQYYVS